MPVRLHDLNKLNTFSFKVTINKFSYLGIQVTRKYQYLIKDKFSPLISRLQLCILADIASNAIKTVCLPQLLYLFQNLPIYLNKGLFRFYQSPNLLNNKCTRIKKIHLFATLGCQCPCLDVLFSLFHCLLKIIAITKIRRLLPI